MARKKKKKHEDEHVDESWLVPYADILTLLLALFIVLYASSSIDAAKFQMLSKSFNEVFTGGTGVLIIPASPLLKMSQTESMKWKRKKKRKRKTRN